ncbi:MAG: hypothetical protein M0Z53_04450 [Thermaerobacter sp.]|nr:hypothetical protein [Thermaerobacter sp.]
MKLVHHLIGPHFWVKQTPEWHAVVEAFSLPMFRDAERDRLMRYVDLNKRRIDWDAIHQEARDLSTEKRVLIRVAHALHSGGDCQLSEIGALSSAGRSAAILLIGQRYRQ